MNRRGLVIAAAAAPTLYPALAATKPHRLKPQVGDVLVHAFGDRAGVIVVPGHIGNTPLFAFPMERASGLVRNGSLHNQVAILRVDPVALSAKAERYAVSADADSFLVYSAACTHTGCEVSGWQEERKRLVCPCHGSEFDVHDAARVMGGPAPKPLAMLTVELVDEAFQVAGGFSRRVGAAPP